MATQTVDFTVIPTEDLFLSHGNKKLKRVSKGDPYPCQMQKTQNFSCLFRHYAKHNGLDKETLMFTFLEELLGDQLPEMVHLLTGDEIFVSHRKVKKEEQQPNLTDGLIECLDKVRNDASAWDVKFIFVNELGAVIGANKCVICNRSKYFDALFRSSAMLESVQNSVEIVNHTQHAFTAMLEFLYTARVKLLHTFTTQECMDLLLLANEYTIDDLKLLCQRAISKHIDLYNVSKLFPITEIIDAPLLRSNIETFIAGNIKLLNHTETFRKDYQDQPKLAAIVLELFARSCGDEPSSKRRRISNSPLGSGFGASEVTNIEPPTTALGAQNLLGVLEFDDAGGDAVEGQVVEGDGNGV